MILRARRAETREEVEAVARREGSMDPRAIRTRNAFLDAAETLQREKKTEDITVSAIVGLSLIHI